MAQKDGIMDGVASFGPKAEKKAGQRVKAQIATQAPNPANYSTSKGQLPSYKKGGIVKETGPALVHKGEKIIPNKRGTSNGYMTSCK